MDGEDTEMIISNTHANQVLWTEVEELGHGCLQAAEVKGNGNTGRQGRSAKGPRRPTGPSLD